MTRRLSVLPAAGGGGGYFELNRDPDRDIAKAIIDAGRRQAPAQASRPSAWPGCSGSRE